MFVFESHGRSSWVHPRGGLRLCPWHCAEEEARLSLHTACAQLFLVYVPSFLCIFSLRMWIPGTQEMAVLHVSVSSSNPQHHGWFPKNHLRSFMSLEPGALLGITQSSSKNMGCKARATCFSDRTPPPPPLASS